MKPRISTRSKTRGMSWMQTGLWARPCHTAGAQWGHIYLLCLFCWNTQQTLLCNCQPLALLRRLNQTSVNPTQSELFHVHICCIYGAVPARRDGCMFWFRSTAEPSPEKDDLRTPSHSLRHWSSYLHYQHLNYVLKYWVASTHKQGTSLKMVLVSRLLEQTRGNKP